MVQIVDRDHSRGKDGITIDQVVAPILAVFLSDLKHGNNGFYLAIYRFCCYYFCLVAAFYHSDVQKDEKIEGAVLKVSATVIWNLLAVVP